MITVIVESAQDAESLATCLASLVPAAVDGIVREVILVAAAPSEAVCSLAEDSGAGLTGDLETAIAAAKSDWLLILPATVRLEEGWQREAAVHVQRHGDRAARFRRAGVLGWFRRSGLLVRKDRRGVVRRPRLLDGRAFPA
ncbi:MAG: cell wall biosynthesis glycosyltransferase [Pseudomonadota bacterium]